MIGWRVTRRMPRAGSAALSAASCITAVGLRVMTPAARRISANGMTTSGRSLSSGSCHSGWNGALA